MTPRSRYTVPLDELEQVHVDVEQQVSTRSASGQPVEAGGWGGALPPAYGAGGSAVGGGGGGELGGDGD